MIEYRESDIREFLEIKKELRKMAKKLRERDLNIKSNPDNDVYNRDIKQNLNEKGI